MAAAEPSRVFPRPTGEPAIAIASPPSGATDSINPTLRAEFQAVPLRAATPRKTPVKWRINDRTLGRTTSDMPLMWPLRPGTHHIVARDGEGHTAESTIVVR